MLDPIEFRKKLQDNLVFSFESFDVAYEESSRVDCYIAGLNHAIEEAEKLVASMQGLPACEF